MLPLQLDAPLAGLNGLSLQDIWQLPVIKKEFDCQPQYYFGQKVLHKMKVRKGEILHPVEVIGIEWMGDDWSYCCELPFDHPEFKEKTHERVWLENWELEAM